MLKVVADVDSTSSFMPVVEVPNPMPVAIVLLFRVCAWYHVRTPNSFRPGGMEYKILYLYKLDC